MRIGVVALGVAVFASSSVLAAGYKVPRNGDGTPDFQGYWTNTTATPMERDPKLGMRRGYTEAEALAIKAKEIGRASCRERVFVGV